MAKYKIIATTYDRRGRVLSKAENSYSKTHTIQAMYANKAGDKHRVYLHAEILAIIRAKGRFIHKIRVERYDKFGKERLACPCKICSLAIKEANIKYVEYTTGF